MEALKRLFRQALFCFLANFLLLLLLLWLMQFKKRIELIDVDSSDVLFAAIEAIKKASAKVDAKEAAAKAKAKKGVKNGYLPLKVKLYTSLIFFFHSCVSTITHELNQSISLLTYIYILAAKQKLHMESAKS